MASMHWIVRIALPLTAPAAMAQHVSTVAPGTVVRIAEHGAARAEFLSGSVVAITGDTLVLDLTGAQRRSFAVSRISRVELRTRRRHVWEGAGIGLLTGAAVGGIVGYLSADDEWRGLAALYGVGAGSALGLEIGAIAGALHRTDRWTPLPASQWMLSASPTGTGGLALTLTTRR